MLTGRLRPAQARSAASALARGRQVPSRASAAADAIQQLSVALNAARDELQQRQRLLETLLQNTQAGLWDWNVQTGALDINERFAAITGHAIADLQPSSLRHWIERVHPDDRPSAEDQLRRHIDGEQPHFDIECRLRHREGPWIWVHARGQVVTRTPAGQPLRLLGTQLDITERKELEHQLFDAAHTDRLTGLPNRAMMLQRLELAVAFLQVDPSERFALFFLDFDRFKNINDTLGHAAGDQLLIQIAGRLRGALRVGDVHGGGGNAVARFGGDEFVVLLGDARTPDEASRIAGQLLKVFAAPYDLLGQDVHSSVSIGIAMGEADGRSADDMLRDADIAMYEAKRTGRGRAVFFDRAMHERLTRELAMEAALRGSVDKGEFSLVYQPIVDLDTGAITAVEGLLRWLHPELGEVHPSEFVPVAEESALIVPIGEWVLREACQHWMGWWRTLGERVPPVLSVNVSRVQLQQADRLVAHVGAVLEQTGMPAHRLQLEVTEREIVKDPASMRHLLGRLRAMGVRVAMDDFGTGGSTLSCLRDFPFDIVKIDKSLLDGLADNPDVLAVIHATVTLIENLGMASVAEGVEDAAQIGILQAIGCRFAQGFLFASPVPPQQVPGLPALATMAL